MVSIPLTGLSTNDPVPGNYIEVNFAQGPVSGASAPYSIMLLGNMLSTGTATPDTVYYGPTSATPLASLTDAQNLFGAGSELYRMYKRAIAINNTTPIFAIAVTESVGSKATGTITITGAATVPCSIRIFFEDEFVDVSVSTSDTPTNIAANAVSAFNARTDFAAVASNASGVLTLTAKQKGLRGNWLRYSCKTFPVNSGVTVTATSPTLFTGGTTADSNVAALATILPYRFYYTVSAAEDATQLGNVTTQINTMALPTNGLRQTVIGGSVDTVANVTTIATGLNAARACVVWQPGSDWTPAELAANLAAIVALEQSGASPQLNFSGYGNNAGDIWRVKAPLSGTTPTRAQQYSALNNGITPIASTSSGSSYLVKLITTRSLNGAVNDYRIRDYHKVTVCDRFGDDWQAKSNAQFSGKVLADDPKPGTTVANASVVSPRSIKSSLVRLVRDYFEAGLIQDVDTVVAGVIVGRENTNPSRVSCLVPLSPVDILDQLATAVNQVR